MSRNSQRPKSLKKSSAALNGQARTLFRVMDANFNRAKEGLRVCEDVCRFWRDSKSETRFYKNLRHRLTNVMQRLPLRDVIKARDIEGDVGRKSSALESRRRNVEEIFYANSQRVKESLRVLEEFAKLIDAQAAEDLKKLRYAAYSVEKKVIGRLSA